MAIATATDVRTMANWPTGVSDPMLAPHIDGASRDLRAAITPDKYAEITDGADADLKAMCAEIEACFAIAYAIPALHMLQLEGAPGLPKAVSELEFTFLDQDEAAALADTWRERGERRLAQLDVTDDGEAVNPAPRMYAI